MSCVVEAGRPARRTAEAADSVLGSRPHDGDVGAIDPALRSRDPHHLFKSCRETILHSMSEKEQTPLLAAIDMTRVIEVGSDIAADGSMPTHSTVILSGVACR